MSSAPPLPNHTETPRYRAYFLSDRNAVEGPAIILAADHDDDAERQARALARTQAVELWDGARRLGRFEPDRDAGLT